MSSIVLKPDLQTNIRQQVLRCTHRMHESLVGSACYATATGTTLPGLGYIDDSCHLI